MTYISYEYILFIIYLYHLLKSVISNTDNKSFIETSVLQFIHLAEAKFARQLVFVISVIKAGIASVEFYEENWKPIFCSPDTKIQLSAEFTWKVDNDILIQGMNNEVDTLKPWRNIATRARVLDLFIFTKVRYHNIPCIKINIILARPACNMCYLQSQIQYMCCHMLSCLS